MQTGSPVPTPCFTCFTCAGEIRFGPAFYTLEADGHDFGQRIFGLDAAWSGDGRFLTVQEWHNRDESRGPRTALLVIDLERRREASLAVVRGFAVPVSFSGHLLRHEDQDWSSGSCAKVELETDVDQLPRWTDLARPDAAPGRR